MSGDFKCYPLSSASPCIQNCRPLPPSTHFQHKLVVASKYCIALAAVNTQEIVAFHSTVTQNTTSTVVNAGTHTKVTAVDQGEILSIGLNADESFLGVFVNKQQGCFVLVYDVLTLSVDIPGEAFALTTIRIGNSYSKGLAFEWNPASSDLFAASDNENTLSVCRVDVDNPSKYSIIGEKKLDANIHEVSWSPKGKQLVVGDALGRIFQLKPDLELVRMTNAPETAVGVKVICLCWLSTTEWLVAYSNDQNPNAATFILSIKKDKPPSWISVSLPLLSSFGVTRRLLVEWNVVLIATPGTSQLLSLCKHAGATDWSVTSLVSLPEPTTTNFIIGIAINLSNAEACTIEGFSTRRIPSVMLLRSDGSVHSLWIAPPSHVYPDCCVSSTVVDVSMIRTGIRLPAHNSVTETPISVTVGLTAVTSSNVDAPTTLQPLSKPSSTNLFSSAPFVLPGVTSDGINSDRSAITTQSQLNVTEGGIKSSTQNPSLFGFSKNLQGNVASLTPSSVQKLVASTPVVAKPSIQADLHITDSRKELSTHLSSNEKTSVGERVGPCDITKTDLSTVRSLTQESIKLFLRNWNSIHRSTHSFYLNLLNAGRHIDEAIGSLSHVDNVEATDEIQQMIVDLDDEMTELLSTLKEKKNVVDEKMATKKQCENAGLVAGYSLNLERSQYENVVQKYEDFMLKLHQAKRMIMEAKKISAKNKPRRLTDFDPKFDGRLQEGLKNMARYSEAVRSRVAELERAVSYLTSLNKVNSAADPHVSKERVAGHTSFREVRGPIFIRNSWKPMYLQQNASKPELRAKLLAILKDKKDGKNAIKKIDILRFDCAPSDDTLSSSFLNSSNIETTLAQKINSPIRIKSMVTMQNASTQADVPLPSQKTASTLTACDHEAFITASVCETATTTTNVPKEASVVFDERKRNGVTVAATATSKPSIEKPVTDQGRSGLPSFSFSSFSTKPSKDTTTCSRENHEQRSSTVPVSAAEGLNQSFKLGFGTQKDVKQPVELGSVGLGSINQKDVKQSLEQYSAGIGSIKEEEVTQSVQLENAEASKFHSVEKMEEKSSLFGDKIQEKPSLFGSAAPATTTKSVFGSLAKPFSFAPEGPPNSASGTVTTATLEDTDKNILKPAQESTTGTVTFSFKSKNATDISESSQPVLSSQPFKFTPKSESVTLGTTASLNIDADEGMDDDGGGTGASSQKTDSIFGGGFMSGIGSTTSTNAGKNVFGMGMSNLLKNASSNRETSSIFSGGGSMLGSNTQPSSFASAAQKAAQMDSVSHSTSSSSVFGSTPKFGGPPVFGGKPIFGSTAPKPPTAFGAGSGSGGAFSAFSGTKNLFGNVSSGSSSVFGGGMSNQSSTKNTLFGGAQLNKSFSTWR